MKNRPVIVTVFLLACFAAAAFVLNHARTGHKLGLPGVKTRPLTGSANLEVILPAEVPGYRSEAKPEDDMVIQRLPKDSSFGQRLYYSNDSNFWAQVNVVMMGTDRSSIHKPQICLTGQGWECDNQATRVEQVPITAPFSYELPVNKYVATKQLTVNGETHTYRGLYVYWYVDGSHYTADQWRWMSWYIPRDLLLTGTLERWSYISYFTVCAPGAEDATFNRMKQFINQTVPQFQLVPRATPAG